jgi:hypothetical protein
MLARSLNAEGLIEEPPATEALKLRRPLVGKLGELVQIARAFAANWSRHLPMGSAPVCGVFPQYLGGVGVRLAFRCIGHFGSLSGLS